MSSRILLLLVAVGLSDCVTAAKFKLNYVAEAEELPGLGSTTFSVAVTDQRPYVTHGSKLPTYLGQYRDGWGIPREVVNEKKVPLAEQMVGDLRRELQSLGLVESSSPSKLMVVRIRDWNFDAGIDSRFWYDVEVSVESASGQALATDRVKDQKIIKGSLLAGPIPAIKKELPVHYAELIRELVRDNPSILAALQVGR